MSIQLSETVRIDNDNAYSDNVSNVDNSGGNTRNSVKKRTTMDTFEKFSLLILVLAYMISVMLKVVYEITECHFSHLQQIFLTGNHSIH